MTATRSFVAPLLRIAGPVALARLGIIGMALVDTIVVGQLAPDELPHQALGWAPTAVFLVAARCRLSRRAPGLRAVQRFRWHGRWPSRRIPRRYPTPERSRQ